MQLPADICEGWWWVGGAHLGSSRSVALYLYRGKDGEWWLSDPADCRLSELAPELTAMERVAPPSWERGDG